MALNLRRPISTQLCSTMLAYLATDSMICVCVSYDSRLLRLSTNSIIYRYHIIFWLSQFWQCHYLCGEKSQKDKPQVSCLINCRKLDTCDVWSFRQIKLKLDWKFLLDYTGGQNCYCTLHNFAVSTRNKNTKVAVLCSGSGKIFCIECHPV